jgi:hypothetical protein
MTEPIKPKVLPPEIMSMIWKIAVDDACSEALDSIYERMFHMHDSCQLSSASGQHLDHPLKNLVLVSKGVKCEAEQVFGISNPGGLLLFTRWCLCILCRTNIDISRGGLRTALRKWTADGV